MTGYSDLVPTAFIVLATFGLLFVVVATILCWKFGYRSVWAFWGLYIVGVSVSCIYKLSGLRNGVSMSIVGRTVYLGGVAFVSIGLPLALAAYVLIRLSQSPKHPPILFQSAAAWITCMILTPVAVVLVAIVDRVYWTITGV
jgi:hypothetical protein